LSKFCTSTAFEKAPGGAITTDINNGDGHGIAETTHFNHAIIIAPLSPTLWPSILLMKTETLNMRAKHALSPGV